MTTMSKEHALHLICEKIAEVFNQDFPCICGQNPLADNLNDLDVEKLNQVLEAIDLIK